MRPLKVLLVIVGELMGVCCYSPRQVFMTLTPVLTSVFVLQVCFGPLFWPRLQFDDSR